MSGGGAHDRAGSAARLLAREQHLAALEQGQDVLAVESDPSEQAALLTGPLQYDAARVGLVFLPGRTHPLAERFSTHSRTPFVLVTPEMTDTERRDLGIALRNRTVQLLLVTPERLSQPKFIHFVRTQNPCYVGVVSCQRLSDDAPDYFPPYASLRALRALFPGVPVLALADDLPGPAVLSHIRSALGLSVTLPTAPVASSSPAEPPQHQKMEGDDEGVVFDRHAVENLDATPRKEPVETPVAVTAPGRPPVQPQDSVPANSAPEIAPQTTEHVPRPSPRRPMRRVPPPAGAREAFPLFADEMPLSDVAARLDKDETWAYAALTAFIQDSGRSNPFPWIDKLSYLTISMVAGQAESTDARLIASVLGGGVDERLIAPVLAALDNRQGGAASLG